jgi:hypothetical protein
MAVEITMMWSFIRWIHNTSRENGQHVFGRTSYCTKLLIWWQRSSKKVCSNVIDAQRLSLGEYLSVSFVCKVAKLCPSQAMPPTHENIHSPVRQRLAYQLHDGTSRTTYLLVGSLRRIQYQLVRRCLPSRANRD